MGPASLVLFGLMDLLAAWGGSGHRHSVSVVLGATGLLWAARVVMQIASPQGSVSALLQCCRHPLPRGLARRGEVRPN